MTIIQTGFEEGDVTLSSKIRKIEFSCWSCGKVVGYIKEDTFYIRCKHLRLKIIKDNDDLKIEYKEGSGSKWIRM